MYGTSPRRRICAKRLVGSAVELLAASLANKYTLAILTARPIDAHINNVAKRPTSKAGLSAVGGRIIYSKPVRFVLAVGISLPADTSRNAKVTRPLYIIISCV